MADTERLPPAHTCLRCQAIDTSIPTDAQLRILATEDWEPKALAFVPHAANQEQAVAAEMLIAAIGRFTHAYGPEIAGARLSAVLDILRVQIIRHRITMRVLKAREPINTRARKAWERGDTNAVREIEAEPTPDYPGKARDNAWLNEGQPAAKQLQEVPA
jgi:hypothetical protein